MTDFVHINLWVAETGGGSYKNIGFHVHVNELDDFIKVILEEGNHTSFRVEDSRPRSLDSEFDPVNWKFVWVNVSDETPLSFLKYLSEEVRTHGLFPAPNEYP